MKTSDKVVEINMTQFLFLFHSNCTKCFLFVQEKSMIFFWRIFKIPISGYALGFRHEKILHTVTLYIAKKYEKFSLC